MPSRAIIGFLPCSFMKVEEEEEEEEVHVQTNYTVLFCLQERAESKTPELCVFYKQDQESVDPERVGQGEA